MVTVTIGFAKLIKLLQIVNNINNFDKTKTLPYIRSTGFCYPMAKTGAAVISEETSVGEVIIDICHHAHLLDERCIWITVVDAELALRCALYASHLTA